MLHHPVRLLLEITFACSLACLLEACSLWSIDDDVSTSPSKAWQAPENAFPKKPLLSELPQKKLGAPLSLYDLFDLALENSPQTRYAWESAKMAASDYGVQKTSFLPTGSISAGVITDHYVTNDSSAKGNEVRTGAALNMSWLLFNFGGREAELCALKESLYAANFDYNQTLQDVALAVQKGYFNLSAAKSSVIAQLASLEDAKMTLKSAEIRFHSGLADLQQVLQARADEQDKRYLLEAAYAQVEQARANLAVAIGLPINVYLDILAPNEANVFFPEVDRLVDDYMQEALTNRPDLLASHAYWQASKNQLSASQKAMLPYLAADFSASKYNGGKSNLQLKEDIQLQIGLKWDVFDLFKDHYQLLKAKAAAKAAEESLKQKELSVLGEVWSAFYLFKSSGKQLEAAVSFLETAQEAFKATQIGYNTGVNSLVDLLNSQDTLASARLKKIAAESQWANSLASLAHATGQLELKLPTGVPF